MTPAERRRLHRRYPTARHRRLVKRGALHVATRRYVLLLWDNVHVR